MRFFLIISLFLFFSNGLMAQDGAKVVSGTILLNEKRVPNFKEILSSLPEKWYVRIDSLVVTDKTAVFSTAGATVMLAWFDYPAPAEEISIAAAISWLWKDAEKVVTANKAQLVVSVVGESSQIGIRQVFMRTSAGILSSLSSASGIYMNDAYLLLSKGYYEEVVRNMGREELPLYCWVYFGVLENGGKSSAYTYGMAEFGWPELEIVDSALPVQDSHALLYEVAQKAIGTGAVWQDGQVVPLSEDRKVTVRLSAAQLIKDNIKTLKIE